MALFELNGNEIKKITLPPQVVKELKEELNRVPKIHFQYPESLATYVLHEYQSGATQKVKQYPTMRTVPLQDTATIDLEKMKFDRSKPDVIIRYSTSFTGLGDKMKFNDSSLTKIPVLSENDYELWWYLKNVSRFIMNGKNEGRTKHKKYSLQLVYPEMDAAVEISKEKSKFAALFHITNNEMEGGLSEPQLKKFAQSYMIRDINKKTESMLRKELKAQVVLDEATGQFSEYPKESPIKGYDYFCFLLKQNFNPECRVVAKQLISRDMVHFDTNSHYWYETNMNAPKHSKGWIGDKIMKVNSGEFEETALSRFFKNKPDVFARLKEKLMDSMRLANEDMSELVEEVEEPLYSDEDNGEKVEDGKSRSQVLVMQAGKDMKAMRFQEARLKYVEAISLGSLSAEKALKLCDEAIEAAAEAAEA